MDEQKLMAALAEGQKNLERSYAYVQISAGF